MKSLIQARARSAAAKSASDDSNVLSAVPANRVHLALRRRQRITFQSDSPDHVFAVESGCVTVDALAPPDRRQVTLILFTGDSIARAAVPPLPQIGLTAMVPTNIVRRLVEGNSAGTGERESAERIAARAGLHAIAIGRLSGEERIATLFLELALNLGRTTPAGISFEIPLTRSDMADYMALNPDTLSRLVSRLRTSGILAMPSRSRAIVKNLAALEALTPLAPAVRALARRPE